METTEKRASVLVVDDDAHVREAYKLILDKDYELILCETGDEAVKYLQGHPADVAILDLKMPFMDGTEVLRRVRRAAPKTEVIIVTGYRSTEMAQECARLGCNDYLPKPFGRKDVIDVVEDALIRRRQRLRR
jgi:DNA-binding NtrC family response regulator